MRLLTLSLPAAFAANCRPSPPPPPLPLPPDHHRLQRHHHGQTCRHPLPKKEATAAAPPAYQWQHQRENVYKSRRLGHIKLSTVFEVFDDGRGNLAISKLLAKKKLYLFCDLHTRR
jgi:hypothetical protein